jgi:hypothetical protein
MLQYIIYFNKIYEVIYDSIPNYTFGRQLFKKALTIRHVFWVTLNLKKLFTWLHWVTFNQS